MNAARTPSGSEKPLVPPMYLAAAGKRSSGLLGLAHSMWLKLCCLHDDVDS